MKDEGRMLQRIHPSSCIPHPFKGRVLMELKIDEGLKALLEQSKDKGYLTFSQVNYYLPDDAVNPEKLDQLLSVLEEQGIELIDESEAEEREAGPSGTGLRDDESRD